MHVWDATSLITCAKFQVDGRLLLDYALDADTITIPMEVKEETVDSGLPRGFPDAVEIRRRVESGRIAVRAAERLSDPLEEVLELYGLQEGDKAVLRMALHEPDDVAVVTDDRLLYIVIQRCERGAMFLPDFVEKHAARGAFDAPTALKLLMAMRSRLPAGFVEHSARRLEGVI